MSRFPALLALSAFAGVLTANVPIPARMPIGRWANPKHTLEIETRACHRGTMCGAIIWADAESQSDARAAGVGRLVGTPLLQDYHQTGGEWLGRVYVPDMGRTFSSRIRLTNADTLTIAGCLVGRFFCRTQVWRRVG